MSGVVFPGLGFGDFSCFDILSLLAVILVSSVPKMGKEDKRSKKKYIRSAHLLKNKIRPNIPPKLLPCCLVGFGFFFQLLRWENREENRGISFLWTGRETEWEHTKIYCHPFLGNQYTWRSVSYRSPGSCILVLVSKPHPRILGGVKTANKRQRVCCDVLITWL